VAPEIPIERNYADLTTAESMLFTLTIVILLIAGLIISRMRLTRSGNSANLGWMSERWLAEHRASHSR
jgi:hypothetical protein